MTPLQIENLVDRVFLAFTPKTAEREESERANPEKRAVFWEGYVDQDLVFAVRYRHLMVVLGVTSDGKLRGRTVYDEDRDDDSHSLSIQEEVRTYWLTAKIKAGRVTKPIPSGGDVILEECLSGTLRRLGIISDNTVQEGRSGGYSSRNLHYLRAILEHIDFDAVEMLSDFDFTWEQFDWATKTDEMQDARSRLLASFPYARQIVSKNGVATDELLRCNATDVEIVSKAAEASGWIPSEAIRTTVGKSKLNRMIEATRGIDRRCFMGIKSFFALHLPPERIPQSSEEWVAFDDLHTYASAFACGQPDRIRRLMDIPGGRYAELMSRLKQTPFGKALSGKGRDGPNTFGAMMAMNEVSSHLVDFILTPAFAERMPDVSREARTVAADRIIFGDKSLNGIIETLHAFHFHQDALSVAINQLCARRRISWSGLTFRKTFQCNRHEMKWLTTPNELIDEGREGPDDKGMQGMSHCVASYIIPCLEGSSHILSVRSKTNGKRCRVATAEIRWYDQDEMFKIRQISGYGNSAPDEEATKAVEQAVWWLNENQWEPITILRNRQENTGIEVRNGSIVGLVRNDKECLSMIRALEPLLPRFARGLDVDGFVEMAACYLPPDPDDNLDNSRGSSM